MFLRVNPSQTGRTRDGGRRVGGPFLMLFSREIGGEIRACVRSVKLRQCGPFMVGYVTLAGVRVFLNGDCGRDGLPLDCGEERCPGIPPIHPERAPLWAKLTPVPDEIADRYWRDYTGSFGPLLRRWAIDNERELRKLKTGRADGEVAS